MLARGADRAVSTNGRDDVAVIVRKGSDAELPSVLGEDAVQAALASPAVRRDGAGDPMRAAEVVVVVALPKKGSPGLSNVTIRGPAGSRNCSRIAAGSGNSARAPASGWPTKATGISARSYRGGSNGKSTRTFDTARRIFSIRPRRHAQIVGPT